MQFEFQKQCSAELQLSQTIHDLAYNLNQKSQTDLTLLDFSKAFDKVSHRHLLLKLNYSGVRGNTKLHHIFSDWMYTECCVWWMHLHPL